MNENYYETASEKLRSLPFGDLLDFSPRSRGKNQHKKISFINENDPRDGSSINSSPVAMRNFLQLTTDAIVS